jgi:Ca-activated chloride channel family protein
MKKNSLIILFLSFTLMGFSQEIDSEKIKREARENVREGNVLYNQLKFSEAEVAYKKALSKTPNYPKASYNLGNAIYQQNRNKEAVAQFEILEKTAPDKMSKAEAYHNMGNSFMKEKQYDKAVASFKNSMRNNSKDEETRYNLALAQELLEEQNQDNKDNKDNKDKNKDDKNKDQKDKEGGDDEKKEDKNDEKDKGKDKENDKSDQKKDQDKKDQKPRPNQLTPEQMKQLLEDMNNEENKTQKKLNAEKTKGKKIKQEKDW